MPRSRQSLGALGAYLLLCASPVTAIADALICTIDDAVVSEEGKFTRTESSEFWKDTLKQLLVDTDSGIVGLGRRSPEAWTIVQRATSLSDFVARSAPDAEVRIRTADGRTTFVYGVPFQFYTGVCSVVR